LYVERSFANKDKNFIIQREDFISVSVDYIPYEAFHTFVDLSFLSVFRLYENIQDKSWSIQRKKFQHVMLSTGNYKEAPLAVIEGQMTLLA